MKSNNSCPGKGKRILPGFDLKEKQDRYSIKGAKREKRK
jgi:hypothetical protein